MNKNSERSSKISEPSRFEWHQDQLSNCQGQYPVSENLSYELILLKGYWPWRLESWSWCHYNRLGTLILELLSEFLFMEVRIFSRLVSDVRSFIQA